MSATGYDAARAALQIVRLKETACYEHSQARAPIERALSARLAPAYANLPLGLRQFTPEFLGHEDATYLRLDTGGPLGGISYGARLTLSRIGFAWNEIERRAVDLDTAADLGEVNRWSFTRQGEPDWMVYGDQTKRRVWRGVRYHEFRPKHRIFCAILPLTGPILRHGTCRKLSEIAGAIWRGEVDEIAAMRAHDAEMDRLCFATAEAKAACRQLALGTFNIDALAAVHPVLVADLRSMDWTYHYADRPSAAYREQETRIRQALTRLPLDEALALFVGLNQFDWDSFSYHLVHHPDVVARERPDRGEGRFSLAA